MPRDFVVVRFLPSLFDDARSLGERVTEFTYEQARRLKFSGLPVRLNHAKSPAAIIGRVEASTVHPGTREAFALMSIEHTPNAENEMRSMFVSNAVADGFYAGASLGHNWNIYPAYDANGNYRDIVDKQPLEISLCSEGLRPNTTIEHFFPCRETLERLERSGMLEKTLARHGFAGSVTKSSSSDPSYINNLAEMIEKRRRAAIVKYRFDRPDPQAMSGSVNASKDAMDAEKSAVETPVPSPEPVPAPVPSATDVAVTEPLLTDPSDQTKTLEALAAEQKRTEALQKELQLRDQRLAEFEHLRAEREAEKKKQEEAARREAELHFQTIQQIIERKKMAGAPVTPNLLENCRAKLADPVNHVEDLKQLAGVMMEASTDVAGLRQQYDTLLQTAEKAAREARTSNEAVHQQKLLALINAQHAQNHGGLRVSNAVPFSTGQHNASLSSATSTGMNSRFQSAAAQAPQQMPVPVQSGTMEASSSAGSTQQMPIDPASPTWARDVYMQLRDQLGREPTAQEVAHGGVVQVRTGAYHASADGGYVEQVVERPRFPEPRAFGAKEFSPEFFQMMLSRVPKYSRREAIAAHQHAMAHTPKAFFDLSRHPKDMS